MSERVYVYYEPLEDVSSVILGQLKCLNNRWNGRMSENIQCYLEDLGKDDASLKNALAYYIMEGDRVISWSMVYDTVSVDYQGNANVYKNIDVYTNKRYRNQGYADCLLQVIKKTVKEQIWCASYCTTIFKRHGIR